MTNNDDLALKLKSAAESATKGSWRRTSTEFNGICVGPFSFTKEEVLARAAEKRDAIFISVANPVNILALLAERDADKKRIADYQHQLSRYSMSPGEADQRRCESRVVRDALGYCMDSENVAPVDLYLKIEELRQRIADLEARTVSVKLPKTIWYEHDDLARDVAVLEKRLVKKALREACAAAGIKLEVGE